MKPNMSRRTPFLGQLVAAFCLYTVVASEYTVTNATCSCVCQGPDNGLSSSSNSSSSVSLSSASSSSISTSVSSSVSSASSSTSTFASVLNSTLTTSTSVVSSTSASSALPFNSTTTSATSLASSTSASSVLFSNSTTTSTTSLVSSTTSTSSALSSTSTTTSVTPLQNTTSTQTTTSFSSSISPTVLQNTTSTYASTTSSIPSISGTNSTTSTNTTATNSTSGITVSGKILVIARSTAASYTATSGLNAYGIPYEVLLVPQSGATLPTLNSSRTAANYGGIIILSEVSYQYTNSFNSALTADQWQTMYDYQTAFGVRMVRFDVYPDSSFGTTTAIPGTGCCASDVEQLISITNSTAFLTAGLVPNAGLSTKGLWHYPATIIDPSIAIEIAQFAAAGSFTKPTTAAIINTFGKRQQMVWFTSGATEWSQTTNFLMHAHINWVTRGLYVGRRRIFFNTQVDDMQLATYLYQPVDGRFRTRPSDMDAHVAWQANLNTRLPAGSSYIIEMGHNGNGNIEWAINNDTNGICDPPSMIQYDAPADTALEFQKIPGTGTDLWPNTPATYAWSKECTALDDLAVWFTIPKNRDAFAHISHTFSHENLDNATYSDTNKELTFNIAWLQQSGLSAGKFSGNSLIPPAITGLHNGDSIKAFLDNGFKYVVGDSSRPPLLNKVNEHWPLISTVESNGYAGLTILPRWSLPIYYNCDVANCTLNEWINTSKGSGNFEDLLTFSRSTYTRHLLGLHHDGFMFHQANMRHGDTPAYTVNGVSGNLSLMQIFVETIVQEMTRLTTWPMISVQQSVIGLEFEQRMARDNCQPAFSWGLSSDASSIVNVTVTANSNSCSVPIPLTLPVPATTSNGVFRDEQLGSDPLTKWTTLSGSAVTYTLSKALPV